MTYCNPHVADPDEVCTTKFENERCGEPAKVTCNHGSWCEDTNCIATCEESWMFHLDQEGIVPKGV